MNKVYEYIRLPFDFGDLEAMNKLGSVGWRVILVHRNDQKYAEFELVALMEREHEANIFATHRVPDIGRASAVRLPTPNPEGESGTLPEDARGKNL